MASDHRTDAREWGRAFEYLLVVELGLLAGALFKIISRYIATIEMATRTYAITYTGGLVSALADAPGLWYASMTEPPFMPTIYPPGSLGLYAAAAAVLPVSTPIATRVVGHAAALGAGVLVGLIAYRISDRRAAGVVAGGLYLLAPAVFRATVWSRVDHFGMLFGVLALYLFVRDRHLIWVALACVTALYMKQSLVVFPAAILVALVARGAWRRAGAFVAVVGGVGGMGLVALLVATSGRAWTHLVIYNGAQPWRLPYWTTQIAYVVVQFGPLLAVAAYVLATRQQRTPVVIRAFALLSAAWVVVSVGKLGAWIGYAYPLVAAAAILVGVWSVDWIAQERRPDWRTCVVVLLVLTQAGIYASWGGGPAVEADNQERVAALIAGDAPVLSEDASLPGVEPMDPLLLQYATWDEFRLVTRIEAQRYGGIVMWNGLNHRGTRWSRAQITAIENHYTLSNRFGRYHVYRPTASDS